MKKARRFRYHATPQKQTLTHAGSLIGCTDTAFAMLVDAATLGGCLVTERDIRRISGEAHPDPDSPGLNLNQLERAAERLHVVFTNRTGDSWAKMLDALEHNQRVVAQLWYADMGGGAIGHAYYVEKVVGGRARVVDPVKGVYSLVSADRLHKAMRTWARKAGLGVGLYWGASRPTQWLSPNQRPKEGD